MPLTHEQKSDLLNLTDGSELSSGCQIQEKKKCGRMSKFLMHNVENSLRAAITHMEACDGLPFRVFIKSPDIRKGLVAQGFSPLPKSNETKENGDRAWQNRMLLC